MLHPYLHGAPPVKKTERGLGVFNNKAYSKSPKQAGFT